MENEENKLDVLKTETEKSNFSDRFHERDSLLENNIVEEVKNSFLEYSMSVITSRVLPDLRDGLKPVHRRILWSMYNSGYTPDKPHRKSAKTVGEVMGNYHPHGDSSIYEAMVRMAQDFKQRYLLIDGHGNFGNIEGDGPAAMRYTESRLSKLSLELLSDIKKNTVDMIKNFDETLEEPVVLPSRFPNILVNGTMGIAVGMATNIPPHNLGEVIDGCIAYIDNHDIDTLELMQYIKGPDFPTGGIILGNSGIRKAYETGRGSITIRSKAVIEESNNHNSIVITEVPYGVSTIKLKNKDVTKESIRQKCIDGFAHIPEDRHKHGLVLDYTLQENLVLQSYFTKRFQKFGFLKFNEIKSYAKYLIEKFDIRSGQGENSIVRGMSGGNQQKAIIARELDRNPELVIAVQPVRGLDVGAIEYIHNQIVSQRDKGKAVLLVSLELDEVMNLSDRILVMYEGEIVADVNPKEVTIQELGLYMAGTKRSVKNE